MKYMIGFPISWVLCYLIFAFTNFAWDAGTWGAPDRMLCAIFGMIWGTALSYRISQDCRWAF